MNNAAQKCLEGWNADAGVDAGKNYISQQLSEFYLSQDMNTWKNMEILKIGEVPDKLR